MCAYLHVLDASFPHSLIPALYSSNSSTVFVVECLLSSLISMPGPNTADTRPAPLVHRGHTSLIWSVAFAPDGNSLASGSWDDTVCIWDAYSPSAIGEPLTGHTDSVFSVSYSPLGDIIASGSRDNTIRLWDTSTHRQVGQPLKAHTDDVRSVAFSPDASLIASGSYDCTIRVWDVKRRQPVSRPFEGHTAWVRSVAFAPASARIVSGSDDKTIRIWDVERGQPVVGPLQGHTDLVLSVSLSLDGSQIISGSWDKTLRLWDTRSGTMIGEPFEGHTDWVHSVSFSPSGTYVASGSRDNTVRVWDVRTCRQLDEPLEQHTGEVNSVVFSPTGSHIASGLSDKTVIIWDVSGREFSDENKPHIVAGEVSDPSETQGPQRVDSELEPDSHPGTKDNITLADGDHQDPLVTHMSIQDMFDLLSDHGCIDFGSHMDPIQHSAVLMSGGGFGDIWKGELLNGTKVAIKVWRASLIEQCDYKILKRATREIYLWSKMKHTSVHELMGVVLFKGQSLGMVSEWMENGNLHEYLRNHPDANRYQLSVQVASGVAYIHTFGMVHGDIKALNVLISSNGNAKLTDFGLSTMSESSLEFSATTSQAGW
ncbi:unnamed protein product [Rhizoctonia solani]|uniref:Protein kinase domain-containing protein n=1 Tax=Rhizoctonia solani TaxID=456999 RepID=A0A8H3CWM1_9AGAM|nr:unnamed protein product [Rhizoctonia solani]